MVAHESLFDVCQQRTNNVNWATLRQCFDSTLSYATSWAVSSWTTEIARGQPGLEEPATGGQGSVVIIIRRSEEIGVEQMTMKDNRKLKKNMNGPSPPP